MRTVYLGTSDFAATVLERLATSAHRPSLVVTRPDRPRGRGRRVAAPPIAEAARALGIDVDQPDDLNGEAARQRIAAARPDAVCVCAFGALVREPLLSQQLMLNVHPSLLPRWRGAAPIERAIMAGDAETGVTIMQMTAGLDSGPVCLRGVELIRPEDSYGSLAPRLAAMGGELLVEALDEWPLELVPQDDAAATYAEKIGPRDRTLDPSRSPAEAERAVRALHPHIGARVERNAGEPLRVHEAVAVEGEGPPEGALAAVDGRLLWGCAGGALELRVLQPPGGRPMDEAAFLRGHPL